MAALSYGAMDPLGGPGLAPLALPPAPHPDPIAVPAGYLVEMDGAVRIHFLDWSGEAGTLAAAEAAEAEAGHAAAAEADERAGHHASARARPAGGPGILLLHGLTQTAWTWTSVARRLCGTARVVAMDLRGHGLSDAPTTGCDPDQLAEDAIAVGEGSGILAPPDEEPRGPFVVAGLGYGAIVAAWTAHALGERCAGLVLVDGGWEDLAAATGATPDEWLAAIEEPPEVLASMSAWLADREAFDPASWDEDQERAARAQVVETAAGRVKIAVHPHALRGSVEAMWTYDPAAVVPDVEAAIVALLARDDDGSRLVALRDAARARAVTGRPPIRAGSFPDRGHNLPRHEPDAVASAVLAAPAGSTMRR
jgi:pimeloyl-ACP methyl ester carboxylesterase